jgi:hypothetical protein
VLCDSTFIWVSGKEAGNNAAELNLRQKIPDGQEKTIDNRRPPE